MTERRPLILRTDTDPPRLQELPAGDLLPADTLGNALQVLLQGLVTGNNAGITSTDTVLQALGKLQAQTNVPTDLSLGAATANSRVVSISKGAGITLPAATSSTAGLMTAAESAKLSTVATNASANSSDAFLLNRSNHSGTQPLSTITGVGTAAAMNVQTSQLDTTAGRLMPVGAFGLGKPCVYNGISLNNFAQFPWGTSHGYLNGVSDAPYAAYYGYLTMEKVDEQHMIQTVKATGNGEIHKRCVSGGVAAPWIKVIDNVSAVGAIVSGSIIERGSNANGEYVKFADGTLICNASRKPVYENVSNLRFMWTFPAGFVAVPNVFANEVGGDLAVAKAHSTCAYSIDNLNAAVSCLSTGTFVATDVNLVTLQAVAIGRWK